MGSINHKSVGYMCQNYLTSPQWFVFQLRPNLAFVFIHWHFIRRSLSPTSGVNESQFLVLIKHNLPHACCWKWKALMWVLVGVEVAAIQASCKFLLVRVLLRRSAARPLSGQGCAHIKAKPVAAFRPLSVQVVLFSLSVWTTFNQQKRNESRYYCWKHGESDLRDSYCFFGQESK